jgi:hypothetical protein
VPRCSAPFDLLELDGEDLRRQPIEQRKARLARLLPKSLQGMARKMPRYGLPESKWANPFKPRHHTREEQERVTAASERRLYETGLIDQIHELRGRDVVCWCKPCRAMATCYCGSRMDDRLAPAPDHWLPGFNFNVEEWFENDHYETLAICCTLEPARTAFAFAVAEKPGGWFMIPEQDTGGEAISRGRLVRTNPKRP